MRCIFITFKAFSVLIVYKCFITFYYNSDIERKGGWGANHAVLTHALQKQKENFSTLEKHISNFIKRKMEYISHLIIHAGKTFFSFLPKADKSNYLI